MLGISAANFEILVCTGARIDHLANPDLDQMAELIVRSSVAG
jgi:hypothetical protein